MHRASILATLLLALQVGLLAYGAWIHSPTFDETAHLPAGLAYWERGREDVYPHNPPLVRTWAAIPLLFVEHKVDWTALGETNPANRPEFQLGRAFIAANEERSFWLYTLARWMCLPFAVLGGWVCYRWASDLYGPWGGLLSVWLWCFCPNILGSGQWIAPDLAATALGVLAGYRFWRWLGAPTWLNALAAGAALGVAELSKFTWVILFVLWPVFWLCVRGPSRGKLGQLIVILVLGLYVLNLGYLFRGSFARIDKYDYYSHALGGPLATKATPNNRFRGEWWGALPAPLPRAYLAGIDLQKLDFEFGFRSYLHGQWKHGGWWYYYLYGLGIKVPLGTLALLVWAILAGRRGDGESRRDLICVLGPPLVLLAFVSSQTGFSHHLRYVLPVFPFAFVFCGRLLGGESSRLQRMGVAVLAGCTALASLSVYPHHASFFNRLVGGPLRGSEHLVDSNISWGQDLLLLREWLARNGKQQEKLHLAYFGNFDPRMAGLSFTTPPLGPAKVAAPAAGKAARQAAPGAELGPIPGLHVVDVSLLRGMEQVMPDGAGGWRWTIEGQTDLSYFLDLAPSDRIGYSLLVYELSAADVNPIRQARRLPPWPDPQRP
ncbi:MAG: glycosyltransferase family 39 protein [Pirellulales bacterium]